MQDNVTAAGEGNNTTTLSPDQVKTQQQNKNIGANKKAVVDQDNNAIVYDDTADAETEIKNRDTNATSPSEMPVTPSIQSKMDLLEESKKKDQQKKLEAILKPPEQQKPKTPEPPPKKEPTESERMWLAMEANIQQKLKKNSGWAMEQG